MAKIQTFNVTTRWTFAALVIAGLAVSAGHASASGRGYMDSLPKGPSQTIETSRGPVFTTGSVGSMQTTTLPGGAGQALLTNNSNGTSTLVVPGGLPQVVASPG
jgi:hypothetical protein